MGNDEVVFGGSEESRRGMSEVLFGSEVDEECASSASSSQSRSSSDIECVGGCIRSREVVQVHYQGCECTRPDGE